MAISPHKGHLSDSDISGALFKSPFGFAHFTFPNQSVPIFVASGYLIEDLFHNRCEDISGFILQDWQGMIPESCMKINEKLG